MHTPPSFQDIEQKFLDLIEGRSTRQEINNWAGNWISLDYPPEMPKACWEALLKLYGVDLRDAPDGDYLHSDVQIMDWYQSFIKDKRKDS